MRSLSISSRISDYRSVININDFENASQFNIERNSFGSFKNNNSEIDHKNTFTKDFNYKNGFNSSISVIKINPKKNNIFDEKIYVGSSKNNSSRRMYYVPPFNNKNNRKVSKVSEVSESSSSIKYRKNSGVIKIVKDNKMNKNDLMTQNIPRSPQTLEPINDLFEF